MQNLQTVKGDGVFMMEITELHILSVVIRYWIGTTVVFFGQGRNCMSEKIIKSI